MVVRGGTIINLAGTKEIIDPEYRYKMPAIFGKIEGSGNGIKTVLPNISEVGTSLHRTPGEVNKFFGTELGAQSRYNPDTDRAIVNGEHTDATLQELIKRYIDKFVLCPNCGLPETEYKIKNDTIFHKCAACGAKEMVDMSHKLCNFILAENKKAKKDGKGKNKKEDKKSKKKDKDGSDEDKKSKKDKKDKKKDKKKKDKDGADDTENGDKNYLKEAMFGKKEDDAFGEEPEDDNESVVSEAEVDDKGARQLAVEAVRKFLDEKPDCKPAELVEVVTNQQMASALKSQDKVYSLVAAAITPAFFKSKEVTKFAPAVGMITNGNKIMERHLIASLEAISLEKPKNFPVLIKQFYDEDVLAEETILEWADAGRSEYTYDVVDEETRAALRGEAEPVVVWLQEADSDDDSDDEDESD